MSKERELSSLSVVAPFLNEEAGLREFYRTLVEALEQIHPDFDLIFVDDGSEDGTLSLLNQIADRDPRVSVVSLSRNFGHQVALTAGLDVAKGEAVVVMDSDLQHPPETIAQMIAEYEKGADVVYAVRERPQGLGLAKRATANLYYAVLERLTNVRMVRGAADFRLMSRASVEVLRQMRETHRYLRGMAPWLGFRSAAVRYQQPARSAGAPSYTFRKSLRMARHGLFSFSTVPLEVVSWLGLLLTLLGGIYLVYVVTTWMSGTAVPGWASVIVVVLVIGGVQLITLGILAQYLGMVFEQVKKRPLYVLKQKRLSSQREPAPRT